MSIAKSTAASEGHADADSARTFRWQEATNQTPGLASFFENLETFVELPDTYPKIRELILQWAVRGRLTVQNENEESDSLLCEVRASKQSLIQSNQIKGLKPFKEVSEFPFSIPTNWSWIRLGDAMSMVNGKSFKKSEWSRDGLPIIRIQNLNNHDAPFNYCNTEVAEKYHVKNGDFLISWSGTPGTSFGAFIWDRGDGLLNQHIYLCTLVAEVFHRAFLRLAVNARLDEMIENAHGGVGLRHITKGKLNELALALPPLAEQKRIVAKVNELMALCDTLESQRQERESLRKQATVSVLASLTSASPNSTPGTAATTETLAGAWRRLSDHFEVLLDQPETLDHLRQSILQLAVQGVFTTAYREGTRDDEVAAELLRKVEERRYDWWRKRLPEGSKRKYPPPIDFESKNLPPIPDSWMWTSADAVCAQITDGEHIQPPYIDSGIPMLSAKHVRDGYVTLEGAGRISEEDFAKCKKRCEPENGDILIVSVGATTGRAAVVEGCPPFAIVRSVLLLKPLICKEFFLAWLQSPWCFRWMGQASGASAQPHLYIKDTKRMPFPLPPLAEQKRIVAKVSTLLSQCDELAAQLRARQSTTESLLTALIHRILEGGIEVPG